MIKFELETPRLFLKSFDQETYDLIFSSCNEQEIRQIFGHLNDEEYELFYSLKKDEFKQKGYMSEALLPILEYGKNQMDLYRIEAFVAIDNIPSNRLMQKFGFQKETTLKHRYQFGDEVDTDNFYSLLPNPKYQ